MHALYLNTDSDKVTNLAVPLNLEGYACGLISIRGRINKIVEKDKSIFLCCDIIEESSINEKRLPIIREILRNSRGIVDEKLENIIWLQVLRPYISNVRLYISDENGEIISFPGQKVYCTLLFIPPKKKY